MTGGIFSCEEKVSHTFKHGILDKKPKSFGFKMTIFKIYHQFLTKHMPPKFLYEIYLTILKRFKTELSNWLSINFNTLITSPCFTIMLKISISRKTNRREHTYSSNLESLVPWIWNWLNQYIKRTNQKDSIKCNHWKMFLKIENQVCCALPHLWQHICDCSPL